MPSSQKLLWWTIALAIVSLLIIPVNLLIWFLANGVPWVFYGLAIVQFSTGVVACACGYIHAFRRKATTEVSVAAIVFGLVGLLVGLGGPIGVILAMAAHEAARSFGSGLGGAWGRPLRVRGRVLHPELCEGSDWSRGDRPDVRGLDDDTRAALEALWLHDAQKEHASVPAFARIAWMLCAVGAPGDLVDWCNRSGAEEIDHTRRCFALAAGYGGRAHSAEAMPDLLLGGLEIDGDPLVHLALESLRDGCLLEDFNADVAGACARVCEDAVTRDVLERIAREERSHAEFSWALVGWLSQRGGDKVARALDDAASTLDRVARPTAVSPEKLALVACADRAKLRAHGRIDDAEWAALWSARVTSTRARVARSGDPAMRDAAE